MTVYLVYDDTARGGRRWLGTAGGRWTWGDRAHATRFSTRHQTEAALRHPARQMNVYTDVSSEATGRALKRLGRSLGA